MRSAVLPAVLLPAAFLLPAGLIAQAPFFRSDSVMAITIRTDLRTIKRDRDTAEAPWRDGSLSWTGPDGERTVPVRLRTRGAFRLRHCDLPPLRLRFSDDSTRGTPFEDLRRPKLASYCMDRDEYEQNLLLEYTLYRVQQLFTPFSYPARLVRVTYQDAAGTGRAVVRYGFLTEDPARLAARLGGTPIETQGVRQNQLYRPSAVFLGLWEYFVGNTDWSVPGLHNVELFRIDSLVQPVAYDYDWSGAVNAPYARPDSRLGTRSVRDRVYRGVCLTVEDAEPVLARFEALRDSVAAVYRRTPDLDPRTVERTLSWYGEFYREIADRARFIRDQVRPTCFQ